MALDPWRVATLGAALLGGATWAYTAVEPHLSLVDGFYLTVVTLSTVGYGDVTPASPAGKALTVVLALLGLGFFAGVLVPAWGAVRRHLDGRLFGAHRVAGPSAGAALALAMFGVQLAVGVGLCNALPGDARLPKVTDAASFLDAVYFLVVTSTSIGYGDHFPTTDRGKLAVALYILASLQVRTEAFA